MNARSTNEVREWHDYLRRWLNRMRNFVFIAMPPLTAVSDTDEMWMTLLATVTECSAFGWLMRVEAMELLELLARVDMSVVWCLIAKYCDTAASEAWTKTRYQDIRMLPRYKVKMDWQPLFPHGIPTLSRLTRHMCSGTDHSVHYDIVKKLLLDKWTDTHGGRVFNREVEGYVEVSLDFNFSAGPKPSTTNVERSFGQIERLVRSLTPGARRGTSSFLLLHSLSFDCGDLQPIVLSSIKRIGRLGAPIKSIKLPMCLQPDTPAVREFLDRLIRPAHERGIQSLSLKASFVDHACLEAFGKAIAQSRSLRCVQYDTEYSLNQGSHDRLQWLSLVCALFAPDADHEIQSVGLNIRLLEGLSTTAIRAALRNENGNDLLRPLNSQSREPDDCPYANMGPTPTMAISRPSAVVHESRSDSRDGLISVDATTNAAYRVVRDRSEEDCVGVHVPPHGICSRHRSEVLEMQPMEQREIHSIRHLHLTGVYYGLEYDLLGPAAAIVECVGGSLERLTFQQLVIVSDECDQFFGTIFTNCPKLKRLDLQWCNLQRLRPLCHVNARLESLFFDEMLTEEGDSWTYLLSVLGDPTQTLSRSLRHLLIDFGKDSSDMEDNQVMTQAIQDACLAMLETNRCLARFELVNSKWIASPSWKPQFLAHQGRLLPGRQGPLPAAQTLAFLSIVTRSRRVTSESESKKKHEGKGG